MRGWSPSRSSAPSTSTASGASARIASRASPCSSVRLPGPNRTFRIPLECRDRAVSELVTVWTVPRGRAAPQLSPLSPQGRALRSIVLSSRFSLPYLHPPTSPNTISDPINSLYRSLSILERNTPCACACVREPPIRAGARSLPLGIYGRPLHFTSLRYVARFAALRLPHVLSDLRPSPAGWALSLSVRPRRNAKRARPFGGRTPGDGLARLAGQCERSRLRFDLDQRSTLPILALPFLRRPLEMQLRPQRL